MLITLDENHWASWNGGHYINYYRSEGGHHRRVGNYDCISFAWEKNKPTFMDAWNAFISHELDKDS